MFSIVFTEFLDLIAPFVMLQLVYGINSLYLFVSLTLVPGLVFVFSFS